jgi:hypothetical protein
MGSSPNDEVGNIDIPAVSNFGYKKFKRRITVVTIKENQYFGKNHKTKRLTSFKGTLS